MEFIIDNAIYVILALGSAVALIWPTLTNSGGGVPTVSPAEAVMLMSRSKPVVLDVRDASEFAEGHIQGAKHIPVAELTSRIKEVARKKNKPVLVVCQHGMRSGKACQTLTAQEFTEVYSLKGGLNKWAEAKMPLVKGVSMEGITMYTTGYCPYCANAERLLKSKGVADIHKIQIDTDPALRDEMMEKTGRRTVPQIYIGERHVGGFDDLRALDVAGELDTLLASVAT